MNDSLFNISINDLKALDDKDAVKVFKALLQAEIYRYNIPVTKTQITENIKAADGGIDATIDYNIDEEKEDILKNGQVNYQIKADNSFASLSEGSIYKELLGDDTVKNLKQLSSKETKEQLKPSIRETIEQGKYYVLVSFRAESIGTKKQKAINIIKDILIKCGYKNPKIDIFDCTNLQFAINRYPSIINQITNIPDNINNVSDILKVEKLNEKYYYNQALRDLESTFDDFYNDRTTYKHLRILAEPGVGKTKAVLEFCKKYDFNTLYIETAEKFDDSELYKFLKKNKNVSITLIIDECELSYAQTFFGRLKNTVPQLKLISIYNDLKTNSSDLDTKVIFLPKLTDEDFATILSNDYNIDKTTANNIASFCEGYPRLAHYIGRNYIAQQKPLNNIDDIMEGLIVGNEQDPEIKRLTLCVMLHLSIFKKFGFSEQFEEEKRFILNFIKQEESSLTPIKLDSIVDNLKQKKILQQEHTLYVSPKILHIWLYGKFWENSERKNLAFSSIKDFPTSLKQWFGEMFEYAKNAQIPTDIPKELIEQFGYDDLLEVDSSDFFLNLTKANPKAAINQLNNIFNNLSDQDIINIVTSRMNLVWALQYILFDKDLFLDAIDILYKLAVNENEKVFANNATGIFQQLFHIALPGTETDLETRKNVLTSYFNTATTNEELNLLINTFNSSLTTHHFTRMGGVETQGFEAKQDYQPEKIEEIYNYFETILNLLLSCIKDGKNETLKQNALNAITSNTVTLIRYSKYTYNLILKLYKEISCNDNIKKDILYVEISKIIQRLKLLKNDKNITSAINNFEMLKNKLTENKPIITLETYYNVNIWDITDDRKDPYEYFISKLVDAYKSINHEQRNQLLETFISKKYDNDYYFGVMIARQDPSFSLLDIIIDYYKYSTNKDGLFVVGYFSELYKTSSETYDDYIHKLYKLKLFDLIININSKAFSTNVTAEFASEAIINNLVVEDKINSFAWNTNAPLDITKKLLDFAVTKNTFGTIKAALNILYHNKQIWNSENLDLIFKVLNSVVIVEHSQVSALTNDSYIWTAVLLKYIKAKGKSKESFVLLDKFVAYLADYKNHDAIYAGHIASVLSSATEIDSDATWEVISKYLKFETIIFSPIKTWLRGDDNFDHNVPGAMAKFNIEDIINWIDEDVENRLKIVAYCSPKDLFKNNSFIMRSLLVKYAHNKDLYHYLHINFGNKGWVGKASDYTKNEIEIVKQFKTKEKNKSVLNFMNEHLESLEQDLKRYIIEEERLDF